MNHDDDDDDDDDDEDITALPEDEPEDPSAKTGAGCGPRFWLGMLFLVIAFVWGLSSAFDRSDRTNECRANGGTIQEVDGRVWCIGHNPD